MYWDLRLAEPAADDGARVTVLQVNSGAVCSFAPSHSSCLICKFREQRETKCSVWKLCRRHSNSTRSATFIHPKNTLFRVVSSVVFFFYNKIECFCWQSSLSAISFPLPILFSPRPYVHCLPFSLKKDPFATFHPS